MMLDYLRLGIKDYDEMKSDKTEGCCFITASFGYKIFRLSKCFHAAKVSKISDRFIYIYILEDYYF